MYPIYFCTVIDKRGLWFQGEILQIIGSDSILSWFVIFTIIAEEWENIAQRFSLNFEGTALCQTYTIPLWYGKISRYSMAKIVFSASIQFRSLLILIRPIHAKQTRQNDLLCAHFVLFYLFNAILDGKCAGNMTPVFIKVVCVELFPARAIRIL